MSRVAEPERAEGTPAGGLVLGVGDLGATAAEYAAAVDRPFRRVPVLGDLRSLLRSATDHGSAFLVLRERELTFDRVNELMAASTELGLPVGVLPVPNEVAAATPVRRHAATSGHPTHSALYCDFVDRFPDGTRAAEPVYGAGESAEFLSQLRDGMEAAVIHGHGNGADFRIGSDVLCVQVGTGRPAPGLPGEGFLPCQGDGPCRLDHKTSFRAFHGSGAIRARLLVMMSCATFQPADGLLGSRFQFVRALLSHGHVAAMVTSTRITFGTTELGLAVLRSLRAGVSLGAITLRMNQVTRYGPPSYLCLGDPEHRPSRLPAPAWSSAPASVSRPVAARSEPWTEPLLFAADALDLAAAPEADNSPSERLRTAALTSVPDGEWAEISRTLARTVITDPIGDDDPPWVRLCRPGHQAPGGPCPACDHETSVRGYDSRIYRGYRRVIVRCPRHGVLADLPDRFAARPPVEVAIRDGRLAVTVSDVAGLLVLRGPGQRQGVEIDAAGIELPVAPSGPDVPPAVHVALARGADVGRWRIPLPRGGGVPVG